MAQHAFTSCPICGGEVLAVMREVNCYRVEEFEIDDDDPEAPCIGDSEEGACIETFSNELDHYYCINDHSENEMCRHVARPPKGEAYAH